MTIPKHLQERKRKSIIVEMTLLLTVANPSGVHQSSDFRLTDLTSGLPTDMVGTKQLTASGLHWSAQLSYTGIASANRLTTEEVLVNAITTAKPRTVDELATAIYGAANQHVTQIRGVSRELLSLTIVISAVEVWKDPRIIIISNVETLSNAPPNLPASEMTINERFADKPLTFVFGCKAAVSSADRKLLKSLSMNDSSASVIRERLAEVNVRAAANPVCGNWISKGCLVGSLLRDGSQHSINVGTTQGIVPSIVGGIDIGEFIRSRFRAAPGKKITFVQSAGARGTPTPVPPPVGEPRLFAFSVPGSEISISNDAVRLVLRPGMGHVSIVKNQWSVVQLNEVRYERDFTKELHTSASSITAVPTIDGVQPKSWDYQITLAENGRALNIAQISTALRSKNFERPLPLLGESEELVMVAPDGGLTILVGPSASSGDGIIAARFLLRDFPELAAEMRQEKIDGWKRTTARNDPCPCGSGKKFKKCCGFLP